MGQAVHACVPWRPLYVPMGQGAHVDAVPPGLNVPAGHRLHVAPSNA